MVWNMDMYILFSVSHRIYFPHHLGDTRGTPSGSLYLPSWSSPITAYVVSYRPLYVIAHAHDGVSMEGDGDGRRCIHI